MKHPVHILSLLLILLLFLTGCSTIRYIPITNTEMDTITVTNTITYRDTVLCFTPDTLHHTIKDTSSFLSNAYAESTASISGGYLHHSLITYPRPVTISMPEMKIEKMQFKQTVKEVPVEVEVIKDRIPKWVWYSLGLNIIILIIGIVRIIYLFRS